MRKIIITLLLLVFAFSVLYGEGGKPELTAIHEWGVFTMAPDTLQANSALIGELESLPSHFYRTNLITASTGNNNPPPALARKPVIYAYGTGDGTVGFQLAVTFNGGTPLIYYPKADIWNININAPASQLFGGDLDMVPLGTYSVPTARLDLAANSVVWRGSIIFGNNNFVLPRYYDTLTEDMRVNGSGIFQTSTLNETRMSIRTQPDIESFLYYDGVFPAMKSYVLKSYSKDKIAITNPTGDDQLAWFFIDRMSQKVDNTNIRYAFIPAIKAGETVTASFKTAKISDMSAQISKELVKQGLYEKEANALLRTWHDGFFMTPGLHGLNIIDTAEYNKYIILNVNPKPEEIVRVGIVMYIGIQGSHLVR